MFAFAASICLMAAPEPTAFLTLFAAQTDPYKPQKTHTFAILLRGTDIKTISWLPATMKVRGLAIRPETGMNWSLDETIAWCRKDCINVSVWGPYPVREQFCPRYLAAVCRLESGLIRYKSLDALRPNHHAMNCVHAVQSVVTDHLRPIGPFGYGEPATRETLDLFSPWITSWHSRPELLPSMNVDPSLVTLRDPSHQRTRKENFDSFIPEPRRRR